MDTTVKVRDRMRVMAPVPTGATVAQAADTMEEQGVNVIPVGTDRDIDGTISTRDIALAVKDSTSGKVRDATVHEVMDQVTGFCGEGDSLDRAIGIMREWNLPTLLVRHADGRVTGTISLTDIFLDSGDSSAGGDPAANTDPGRQAEDAPVKTA